MVAASVSEPAIGSGEILVSLARSSMLQCVSIVPGVKSELKCSFKPTPRGGSYVTAPGMCAWSETTSGDRVLRVPRHRRAGGPVRRVEE